MLIATKLEIPGYEGVIEAKDPDTGLHAFLALHNTTMGPALGGTRMYPYRSREDALEDVLRLAKGMTYKSALVEAGLGGGKSVIIGDPAKDKYDRLLESFGEAVNLLEGMYIVAEDIGTSPEDMLVINRKTPYVSALPVETSSGDPSRFTAWGVFLGMKAIASTLWHQETLRGKTVAIQGMGHVGSKLASLLFWEGAELILTDTDEKKLHETAKTFGAAAVPPEEYIKTRCDILSPCALGGILNQETIPMLQCKAVAGSANNQLREEKDGTRLHERGILYAPDYVINAGGLINAAAEFEPGGYNPRHARDKVGAIADSLLVILRRSLEEDKPTEAIANELAEFKLNKGIGKREGPILFTHSPA